MNAGPHCAADDTAASRVHVRSLFAQGAKGTLPARLYTPVSMQGKADRLIVFFPCGGFITAGLDQVDDFVREMAIRTGAAVLASSYTVADISPFPAAVEDAHAVLKWAVRHKGTLRWNGGQMMVAGIEAGGNLAAVAALMARDRGGPDIEAQILIMPMLDPGLTSASMRSVGDGQGIERTADFCAAGYRHYLPRALDRTHPYACPLQSSRLKGLPAALILTADDDPLRDEAEQYGEKLNRAGIAAAITRLPAIALEQPEARCDCARMETALAQIAAFVAERNASKKMKKNT